MQTSSEIAKLGTALAKAQGAIENATKDSTNPHFKSAYADLASVRDAIRLPLSENGIAYVQTARTIERGVEIETMLIHGESGEFVRDTLTMPLAQMTPQAVGSAITYGRRYSLMAMVGLAPEDDDANSAQAAAPKDSGKIVNPKTGRMIDPRSSMQAKARGDWDGNRTDGGFNADNLVDNLRDCHSAVAVQKLWDDYRANTYPGWPRGWPGEADAIFAAALAEHTQDNLEKTLTDSLVVGIAKSQVTPTQNQVHTFLECVNWLKPAKTPDELKSRASNKEYRRGAAILTEDQKSDLRAFYSDTLTSLQSQMLQSG